MHAIDGDTFEVAADSIGERRTVQNVAIEFCTGLIGEKHAVRLSSLLIKTR